VNDIVERRVVKCDLSLDDQQFASYLCHTRYVPILDLTILERSDSCLSKSVQGIADEQV